MITINYKDMALTLDYEAQLDFLNVDFIREIVNRIIPFLSEEYTEQLSDGVRKILGL